MKIKLRHDASDVSTWNAGKLFRHPRLSSIIFPMISAIDSNSDRVSLFLFGRRLSFYWIFFKKSLPNIVIPGIPRLRAATGLRSIRNYIASRPFLHRCARAGAGSFRITSCQSRSRAQEGDRASDHEKNGRSGREKTGTNDHD